MIPAIDALLKLFSHRAKERETLDRVIESLTESDADIEQRLRALRDQVDVYQRTMQPDAPPQEQP